MPFEIKGAPASGWYFSIGADASKKSSYLWTGIAQLHGDRLYGHVVELSGNELGLRLRAEWKGPDMVRGLARVPAAYERVDVPPTSWHGQDIRAAVKEAEEETGKYRARIERLELEYKAR